MKLAKREIAAQHVQAGVAKRRGNRDEQRRAAVRPCAVAQDETIVRSRAGRARRNMQEASNRRFARSLERPNFGGILAQAARL